MWLHSQKWKFPFAGEREPKRIWNALLLNSCDTIAACRRIDPSNCTLYAWCMRIFQGKHAQRHLHVVKLFKISSNMYIYFSLNPLYFHVSSGNGIFDCIAIVSVRIFRSTNTHCSMLHTKMWLFFENGSPFDLKAENRISWTNGQSTVSACAWVCLSTCHLYDVVANMQSNHA